MKKIEAKNVCSITRKVINDFNVMTNSQFKGKYYCSKRRYFKRVKRYGDPYMNAPLAKIGKFLNKIF